MEILNSYQRTKVDESDDLIFYSSPKFVYHLDSNFRKYLTNLYKKEFLNNSVILDLMSSWDSYLPKELNYKKVIGHGLNKQELERNKSLDYFWIQNFNINQELPLGDKSINYCLMVAAWQYLQFPEKLALEISRVLSNKGKLLISFSNRAFWTKSPNIWTYSSEEGRIEYVKRILISNGFNEPKIVRKFTSKSHSLLPFIKSDPFYCVMAERKE